MKMSIAKDNSGEPEASGNADPGEIPPSKEELRLEEAWKALLARRRAKREQDAGNDPRRPDNPASDKAPGGRSL